MSQASSSSQGTSSASLPGGDAPTQQLSVRQQLRQQREQEDLRKFGLAPLAVDAITGQEISPNIPAGLSQAPWYYGIKGPTLEHQRKNATNPDDSRHLDDQVDRVEVLGQQSTFVAGSCTNCGATTHKARDCLMPKRKVGAATSGVVTGVDQHVVAASTSGRPVSFSKKRDTWSGNVSCNDLWESHEKRERDGGLDRSDVVAVRRIEGNATATAQDQLLQSFQASAGDSQGTEIKQLPRYLENLDAGAFYDPITRSMRGNPHAEHGSIHSTFQGENKRISGAAYRDALDMQRRFLSGETDCVVDLNLDAALKTRRDREEHDDAGSIAVAAEGAVVDEREQLLAEMLYQTAAPATSKTAAKAAAVPAATTGGDANVVPAPLQPVPLPPTSSHACIFGSYFDTATLQWGYQCCKSTERSAVCSAAPTAGQQ